MVVTAEATRVLFPVTPAWASVRPLTTSTSGPKARRPPVEMARPDGAASAATNWCWRAPLNGPPSGRDPWSIERPFSAPSSPVDTVSVETNGNDVGGPEPPPRLGGAGAPPPPPSPLPGGFSVPQSPSAAGCSGGFNAPLVAVADSPW